MGAFFTNIQVHTGGRPPAAVRTRVIERIRRLASAADLVEVFDPAAPADRVFLVGPAGTEPWIAVYDELTENQATEDLDHLAGALSRDAGGHAVGVLAHDDDVLLLRLHRDGQFVDAFDSNPDYVREDVMVRMSGLHTRPSPREAPLVERQTDQGSCWEAVLPDYAITAGLQDPFLRAPGESSRRALEAFTATTLHANILGEVVQAGSGTVHLALVPLESAEGGFVLTVTVTVEERPDG